MDSQHSTGTENSVVLTFDLQQNLPVPSLAHGAMFCMRQLWVYNFGIHNCTDGSAIKCVWNECIAGRGSNEISCLLEYFAQTRPKAKEIVRYSDSCFEKKQWFTYLKIEKRSSRMLALLDHSRFKK